MFRNIGRKYLLWGGIIAVVAVILIVGSLTMLSGSGEQVFTEINHGLNGGGASYDEPGFAAEEAAEEAAPAEGDFAGTTATDSEVRVNEPGAPNQQNIERLIIRNADLSLEVASVREALATITSRVGELQGYMVQSETYGSDENLTANLTFRVPAEQFDQALADLEEMADEVLSRSVSGQDVTEEFVDLDARLRTLEATQGRLMTFLNEAETVEESLQVNQALTDIQAQVEQVRGRMEYLEQSAALSTITVRLQHEPVTPLPTADEWQPLRVASEAFAGLVGFGQGLANFGIVLAVWAPVWLPLVLLGLWFFRRRPRKPSSEPPAAPEGAASS